MGGRPGVHILEGSAGVAVPAEPSVISVPSGVERTGEVSGVVVADEFPGVGVVSAWSSGVVVLPVDPFGAVVLPVDVPLPNTLSFRT